MAEEVTQLQLDGLRVKPEACHCGVVRGQVCLGNTQAQRAHVADQVPGFADRSHAVIREHAQVDLSKPRARGVVQTANSRLVPGELAVNRLAVVCTEMQERIESGEVDEEDTALG